MKMHMFVSRMGFFRDRVRSEVRGRLKTILREIHVRAFRHVPILRVPMNALARMKLRHVCHATFAQLYSAGYDVRSFDDGALQFEPEKLTRRELPEQWKVPQTAFAPKVATLRDALLFSNGLAVLPDCGGGGGRYCFSDSTLADLKWPIPHGFNPRGEFIFADHVTDSMLIKRSIPVIDIPGRCFSSCSARTENFGHFVHDDLSRIYYENLGVLAPGREKIIMSTNMRYPIQRVLFEKTFEGYEIVKIPPHAALRVEELLLPANLCKKDKFNPAAIADLARRMRRIVEPYVGKEKYKVCVSRKDGKQKIRKQRDFVNMEAYETRMRELGYRVLNVSELDPESQFALWANTTDIVGVHGAGMMNMIMMPFGANYTEITGTGTGLRKYISVNWIIRCAMSAGLNCGGLAFDSDANGCQKIDLYRLERLLLDT